MEVMIEALGGERLSARVHDPLGRPIEASFGLLREGTTAIVEVAVASGLGLVDPADRDPEGASSRGTGELIAAAIDSGGRRILVAAGGSASTDGGRGAIDALEEAGGLRGARLEVLCDTTTPFERAAEVFAPQKGAPPAQVERLTSRLVAMAGALPRDPRGRTMTGAAGGLSGGLWAAFGAHLVPGAAYVLGMIGFDRRLDAQSREGKLLGEVARRCREARIPLHAIAGEVAIEPGELAKLGFASASEAGTPEAIGEAAERIAAGRG
jgi:glycerate kinase